MGAPDEPHAIYLEYLDKEMTIMGILTAFAVGVPALILDRTMGASNGSVGADLWTAHGATIMLGSFALLFAALFFYRQRSDLAFYYGQIAISITPSAYGEMTTTQLVHKVDCWSSWRHYFRAFCLVTLAFLAYGMVFVADILPWLSGRDVWLATVAGFVVIGVAYWVRERVYHRYDDEYEPWKCWRKSTQGPALPPPP